LPGNPLDNLTPGPQLLPLIPTVDMIVLFLQNLDQKYSNTRK
jgi:hypothetical protein